MAYMELLWKKLLYFKPSRIYPISLNRRVFPWKALFIGVQTQKEDQNYPTRRPINV